MTAVTTGPRATHPGRRIVITTWGSLGDLHPYLAIGLGLKARGHDVILGTAECYRRKVEALGLGFRAVRPDCTWLEDPETLRRLSHPRWGLIRVARTVLPMLRESYEDTLDDPAYGRRASKVGEQVRQEDGVRVACDALGEVLQAGGSVRGVAGRSSRCT